MLPAIILFIFLISCGLLIISKWSKIGSPGNWTMTLTVLILIVVLYGQQFLGIEISAGGVSVQKSLREIRQDQTVQKQVLSHAFQIIDILNERPPIFPDENTGKVLPDKSILRLKKEIDSLQNSLYNK
jgi:hypothetical protein